MKNFTDFRRSQNYHGIITLVPQKGRFGELEFTKNQIKGSSENRVSFNSQEKSLEKYTFLSTTCIYANLISVYLSCRGEIS